jgi:hypothetical protein
VNGRNSDNTLIMQRLGWAPGVSLLEGMEKTYRWINDEMIGPKYAHSSRTVGAAG